MASGGWRFAVAVLVVAAPGLAAAADLPSVAPLPAPAAPAAYTPAPADWTVTIGVEGRVVPAWPGAPETQFGFSGLPQFNIRRAGTPPGFFGARDSFGFSIVDFGQFRLGPAVRLIWQRKASDYAQLNGLGDVDFTVQAGGFAEFWLVPWLRLRGEVRQGFGGETGVTGDVFLDAVVGLGQFRWSGGPRLTLQSADAVSPYFSITAVQAAAANLTTGQPPLTAYNAGGGLYSYGAGTQLEYFWSPQWALRGLFEYERLTGDAANSPLVTQRGSPNQFSFGLGASYSFDMHPLW